MADYSDYWALLILPVSYYYRPQPILWNSGPLRIGIAVIACFAFCATSRVHGYIRNYWYELPEYRLQIYVDSVFISHPELRIPDSVSADLSFAEYPGVSLPQPGRFVDGDTSSSYFACYVSDESGAEFFMMQYYVNEDGSNSGIGIVGAGTYDQVKIEHDLSSGEEERLLKKFEAGFIARLNQYIGQYSAYE